ncbi:MAG: hypothetical protein KDN18_13095 [Verrucomicrobiae bacterium]|nr:hypothetical protein [Verrucomicrobiae bacterium]
MIKLSSKRLAEIEVDYPGFLESLAYFESLELPPCKHCGSTNTAAVQAGVVGRAFRLAQATTKFCLTASGSTEGSLWCRECGKFFGPVGRCDLESYRSRGRISS